MKLIYFEEKGENARNLKGMFAGKNSNITNPTIFVLYMFYERKAVNFLSAPCMWCG